MHFRIQGSRNFGCSPAAPPDWRKSSRRSPTCRNTRSEDLGSDADPIARGILSLVEVHRLREVACLYGFTRFEPAPLATDELEDVGLAVSGAPNFLRCRTGFPQWSKFGEGFFLQISPEALAHWLSQPSVLMRARQLHYRPFGGWHQHDRPAGHRALRVDQDCEPALRREPTDEDALFIEQVRRDLAKDEDLADQARAVNDLNTFQLAFNDKAIGAFRARIGPQ